MNSFVNVRAFLCSGFLFLGLLEAEEKLSPLAPKPDWSALNSFQNTLTAAQFEVFSNDWYAPRGGLLEYTRSDNGKLLFYSDLKKEKPVWTLHFARRPKPFSREPVPARARPLEGVTICLDPGHIGGEFSKLEERFFQIGDDSAIEEAKLNLTTCRHLAVRLEHAGAKVCWTKEGEVPATPLRSSQLRTAAERQLSWSTPLFFSLTSEEQSRLVDLESVKIFYRAAEIRARAEVVARVKPDLTLCIHFNAANWGNPLKPELVSHNRLVLFLCGSFLPSELDLEDQRFDLIQRLLNGWAEVELPVAESIAGSLMQTWGLPPESYENWKSVKPVGNHPYLFTRNLLASRIFESPVVFVEGPYMNNEMVYRRLIAGDYAGEREIDGIVCRSLFREYADAVADGVLKAVEQNPALFGRP